MSCDRVGIYRHLEVDLHFSCVTRACRMSGCLKRRITVFSPYELDADFGSLNYPEFNSIYNAISSETSDSIDGNTNPPPSVLAFVRLG